MEDEAFSAEAASKTLKKTQWCEMRKRLSDVELSKSENMTQYDPLLPQTSDAFFSSNISIPPYLLPQLLVTLVYDSSSSSPYRHLTTSSTVL